jgi:hypothetical protein
MNLVSRKATQIDKRDRIEKEIDSEFRNESDIVFIHEQGDLPTLPPFFPTTTTTTYLGLKKKEVKDISKVYTVLSLRTMLNRSDDELRTKGIPEVRGATLPRLVQLLCHPRYSTPKFKRIFFLTRATFTTEIQFFERLVAFFNETASIERREEVVNIIVSWLREYFDSDWRGCVKLHAAFSSFIDDLNKVSNSISRAYAKQLQDEYAVQSQKQTPNATQMNIPLWSELEQWDLNIVQFDEEQIASTITNYFFSIFQQIREREYFDWLRGEKSGFETLQSVMDLFNRLSAWTSKEIVTVMKLNQRVECFEKLVGVAWRLFEANNFLATKAVLLGLTSSFIQRMERTIKRLSSETITKLNELEATFSPDKNYKRYRKLVEDATLPCIPYLGVHQKDLLFLNDGNSNWINSILINFSKRARMAEVVFDLSFCQIGKYSTTSSNPIFLAYLLHAPLLSDKELHLYSRRADPRDPEMVIAELVQSESEYLNRIIELEKLVEEQKSKIEEFQFQSQFQNNTRLQPNSSNKTSTPIRPSIVTTTPPLQMPNSLASSNNNISSSQTTQTTTPRSTNPRATIMQKRVSRAYNFRKSVYGQNSFASSAFKLDIPTKWSVVDVCSFIELVVGPQWVEAFMENQVLGADLVTMERHELSLFVEDEKVCEDLYTAICRLRETHNLPNNESTQPLKNDSIEGSGCLESPNDSDYLCLSHRPPPRPSQPQSPHQPRQPQPQSPHQPRQSQPQSLHPLPPPPPPPPPPPRSLTNGMNTATETLKVKTEKPTRRAKSPKRNQSGQHGKKSRDKKGLETKLDSNALRSLPSAPVLTSSLPVVYSTSPTTLSLTNSTELTPRNSSFPSLPPIPIGLPAHPNPPPPHSPTPGPRNVILRTSMPSPLKEKEGSDRNK